LKIMPRIPFDPAAFAELEALHLPYATALQFAIRCTLRAHGLPPDAISRTRFDYGRRDGIDVADMPTPTGSQTPGNGNVPPAA
jgi:hypothetical protein